MPRFIATATLSLMLLAPLAACDDGPAAPGDVEAEYVLVAVNGEPPPQPIFENELGELRMEEGQMALTDDGRYIQQINFAQVLVDGPTVQTSRICEGTYSLQGTSLVLDEDECDGRTYQATLEAGVITFEFSDGVDLTWEEI